MDDVQLGQSFEIDGTIWTVIRLELSADNWIAVCTDPVSNMLAVPTAELERRGRAMTITVDKSDRSVQGRRLGQRVVPSLWLWTERQLFGRS